MSNSNGLTRTISRPFGVNRAQKQKRKHGREYKTTPRKGYLHIVKDMRPGDKFKMADETIYTVEGPHPKSIKIPKNMGMCFCKTGSEIG